MTRADRNFFDLASHGFVRVAVAVPRVHLADPAANATEIARLAGEAAGAGAALALFPELSVTGYSLDDLHQQDALLDAALGALDRLRAASAAAPTLLAVGAPLRFDGRLFNCAVLLAAGRVLGVVPKSYLPAYREFYEKRQFAAADAAVSDAVTLLGETVPFGSDLVFRDEAQPDFALHLEICEDVWAPIPPSTYAALRGATVLGNLSASNVTIGKAAYRHQLAAGQSAKLLAAYLYSGAGEGESTTDLAWDGHAMIYENGELLAESERFADDARLVTADVDLQRLVQERARLTTFADCAADHAERLARARVVPFRRERTARIVPLSRAVPRRPFVPRDAARRGERCYEAYNIQVGGLVQRLRASGIGRVVVGVSGGLDSTQALLVAARAMDRLGLPRRHVLAYTLPGYATGAASRANAHKLMEVLGVSAEEIDIRPSCEQMFADIGHPFAKGEKRYDVTFENVQAGERTSHLFRLANQHGALVVGTGDLSEMALGWCTYGVGDQMSHYNVNVSVPKTLLRDLVGWVADSGEVDTETSAVLREVLAAEVSPELVPADAGRGAQGTEATIGPYDLHDFSLYHVTRRGCSPALLAFLALHAWANDLPAAARGAPASRGSPGPPSPGAPGSRGSPGAPTAGAPAPTGTGGDDDEASPYSAAEVLRWQRVFLERFFGTSQFKRSAMPNGPKVGSGGSLSPRGDWRAPSDAGAAVWLAAHDEACAWIERSLAVLRTGQRA